MNLSIDYIETSPNIVSNLKIAFDNIDFKYISRSLNDEYINNPIIYDTYSYHNILDQYVKNYVLLIMYNQTQMYSNIPDWIIIDKNKYTYNNSNINNIFKIIKLLCEKYPSLITDDCYEYAIRYGLYSLLKIFNKYYIGNPNDNKCCICNSNSNIDLIQTPCNCNKHIHIYCMINQSKSTTNRCAICDKSYGSFSKVQMQNHICYPKLNIYSIIDLDNYRANKDIINNFNYNKYIVISPNDIFTQLTYACIYGIDYHVRDLLKTFTDKDFKIFIEICHKNIFKFSNECLSVIALNENSPINIMLMNKCLNCDDYYCNIIHNKILYGRYLWCCNPITTGYVLSMLYFNDNSNINDFSLMIDMKIRLNNKLRIKSSYCNIYFNKDLIFEVLTSKISKNLVIFKKIRQNFIGKNLRLVFFSENNIELYSTTITIPDIKIYGNDIECNICLDEVTKDTDKYITPCGHLFHMTCMDSYFKKNKLIGFHNLECTINRNICQCGGIAINPFNCVVCRTLIER